MIGPMYMERPTSLIASMTLHRHSVHLGLKNIVSDFHVTLAYSREPVEWQHPAFTPDTGFLVLTGDDRQISRFGDHVVLEVDSQHLRRRWSQLVMAGASWDHDMYRPHITLAVDPDFDVTGAPAYYGELVLQGERRESLKEDA